MSTKNPKNIEPTKPTDADTDTDAKAEAGADRETLERIIPNLRAHLQLIALVLEGNAIDARAVLDFVPLSARRARVALALDVKPRNLAARVFLQSLKLARAKVNGKFRARFAALCAEVEARLNPSLKMARR